jgi:hypothetical protein
LNDQLVVETYLGRIEKEERTMPDTTKQRADVGHAVAGGGNSDGPPDSALEHIRDALRGLKFGLVSIVVQDGVVIQIERTERKRLR